MRTPLDRVRHAISFEIIGLVIIVFAFKHLGYDAGHIGVLGVVLSVIATGWNYIYNIGFDKFLLKRFGSIKKTTLIRIFHALIFEGGLVIITVPMIACFLNVGLFQALILDIGLVIFYVIYAYVFNLGYDKVFPVPEHAAKESH
ncbi:PACE efflux transporter [Vibrio marisflavi]|uniref:Chlorhexidine efflux transporter domain-containing protein n=1 Tax=Vibrio marisflavi CECT 7928 TaxID=634439 RepID=A0ABM8ZYG2_9VIBR|nr:PACE efflux transporter [Vibrio marisflavi]CAH0535921.1 hypothetical protein VMF7928_00052 [Vibrio marisflavi CECT 7928]